MKLKNWVCLLLYRINVTLIILFLLVISELNDSYIFYLSSIIIISINNKIIKKYGSKYFNKEYMNI